MVTKIIQALAGAGKTHHITNDLNNCKRYLIITYTNANTNQIKNDLLASSLSPDQYIVSTFSKFLIDCFINPYLSSLKPTIPDSKVLLLQYQVNIPRTIHIIIIYVEIMLAIMW